MIKKLNKTTINKQNRPINILQFGEGNFLRAFVDWQLEIANQEEIISAGVAICQPILDKEHNVLKMIDLLNEQDQMYHVLLEGVQNGSPKRQIDLISSVMDAFNPYVDYDKYLSYITSKDLKIIISNTTEAGIRYVEGDSLTAEPPISFPAKMADFLYKRFQYFNGDPDSGLCVICCELIEDNGSTLHKYVIQHAEFNNLPSSFIAWVNNHCHFCDTLVDRIVSGFPKENIEDIKKEIGFDDNLVVKGEFYHLWVIGGEGYKEAQKLLPLDKAGLHVIFTPSIKEFRDKKVRILNGSHTGLVPIALQMGCETVMDAFDTPIIESFIKEMMEEEVLPMIDDDRESLNNFADEILERFYNPYINHKLESIALNSISKWEARNYPTVVDMWNKEGKLAKRELFTLAALLTLYSPNSGFVANDSVDAIIFIRDVWDSADLSTSISKILNNSNIWIKDYSKIEGAIETVTEYVMEIEKVGMEKAINHKF